MGDWITEHITGPVATALVTGAVVPLLIVWYRHRRTFSEIGEGLSKSEAAFRTDLILQVQSLRKQYDEVHKMLLECQKHHAEAEIEIAQLRAEIAGR